MSKLLKKTLIASFLGLFIISGVPTPAQAALSEDIKEQLDEIIAELSSYREVSEVISYLYKGYLGRSTGRTNWYTDNRTPTNTNTPSNSTTLCTLATGLTKTLDIGMKDTQVTSLQRLLNNIARQDTTYQPVTSYAEGSYGNETNHFGTATQNALTRWQVANMGTTYHTRGVLDADTRAKLKQKYCSTSSTGSTPTNTGTNTNTGTTNTAGSNTGTAGNTSGAASQGLILSYEPVAGIPNVFKQVLSGMTVGYTCTFMPYKYSVLSLNSTNPTILAQHKLPSTYGLYWEEYAPLGTGYMKIKEDIAFRAECSNGMVSNFSGAAFTAGGSGNPEDTLELSGGVKVEILQKSEGQVYRSPSETYTVSGLAYGLKRLEVKFTGLHGFSSCDIGLGDAASVGEGKAWNCSRNSANLGPGNVTVEFIGTKTNNETAELGQYIFVVKRFVGDTRYD